MNSKKIFRNYQDYVMPTYSTTPLVLARGKGINVWDDKGKKYLDFFPGWAVSGIWHCHPLVVSAIKKQADKLIHVSNNYYHEGQGKLAEEIIRHSFPGKVFFCNSGAEANEGAIKLARKFGNPARNEIITMERSFHGRTITTVTATGQKKFQKGFEPLPAGFVNIPFNDIDALKKAVTPKTVAIMMEPIQGEGGVNVADAKYLAKVRQLCDEKNILLIFDEVQSGMGRTGKIFSYQNLGVVPDVMTLAKSLGGGFPIGAFVASNKVADVLHAGTHGTTFGGSPLACAASLATFEAIKKEKMLKNATVMGAYLLKRLGELKKKHSVIREVRGVALMAGVELNIEGPTGPWSAPVDGKKIYEECLKRGLLINCTQGNVLRIMPPIIVKKKEINQAMQILDQVLAVHGK
ncbi:MAG: aspartate aminotransferase family protein [Candidatus Kaiserbacteria bacterium]|nr:aspartate aminotransferase family protein [Candidatus Kaiserbacteria bacterium]